MDKSDNVYPQVSNVYPHVIIKMTYGKILSACFKRCFL